MSLGKKLKSIPLVSSAVWHVDHHFEVLHDVQRLQSQSGGDMVLAFEALERVLLRLQAVAATLQSNTATLESVAALRLPVERAADDLIRIESQLVAMAEALDARMRDGFAVLGNRQLNAVLAKGLPPDDLEPEPLLLQFLSAELNSCCAVDVGANEGRVSRRLDDAGLEVFALEPGPEAYGRLQSNLSSRASCHAMQYAAGSFDGEAELHLVTDTTADQRYKSGITLYSTLSRHALIDGLAFSKSVRVPVRRLDSLAAEGQIPTEIGILKVDAEGSDLDVIEGMGGLRPEVVQVEFWDPEFAFGAQGSRNTLMQTVPVLRAMGYRRHIVIARVPDGPVVYYCNLPVSIPNTWGNAIFFREEASFQAARRWCESSITPACLYR